MKELFVVIAMLVYVSLCALTLPLIADIDYYSLVSEGTVAIILAILLFCVRSSRSISQVSYGFFQAGVFCLLLATITDALDELLVQPFWMETLLEDLGLIAGFLMLLFGVRYWIRQDKKLKKHLYDLSTIDDLTGLLNRRAFLEKASAEVTRSARYKRGVALIMLDIDSFKGINDEYGHLVGDTVLKKLAETIRQMLRKTEHVARWGGEEFVLLMPESNQETVMVVAERLRAGIEAMEVEANGKQLQVTISLGAAVLEDGEGTVHQIIDRADKALYAAKNAGRNCVRWNI